MANFQLNTFVSNGFGYAFKNFANFCHFNALNNNPALASNDMTKKTRVQLQYFNKTARFKHLSLPPSPLVCMCVISLSFVHWFFQNTGKCQTSPITLMKYVFKEAKHHTFSSINVFLFWTVLALPSQIWQVFAILMHWPESQLEPQLTSQKRWTKCAKFQ